ncbi:hypothetical protein J2S43_002505 [Catenuloplanes nepalensis]|uniref:Uncharacterized protein n=1 Tax=Catenuloplanes nepalensis TaxID=587533 RepID=A0ABT9MRI3_9ACTN|nr:hypothetical protein [Catenuloplanes nepalensis]MDP9793993.1 hypothetical protein [Catenuloplanes nepalensis]
MTQLLVTRDGRGRGAGRPAPVPSCLGDLHGQRLGVLELPHHMAPGHRSARRYDLADPAQARSAYQHILTHAAGTRELCDLVNRDLLGRMWPHLHLPAAVREAWHERIPLLAA